MKINLYTSDVFDIDYDFSLTDEEMHIAIVNVVIYLNNVSFTHNLVKMKIKIFYVVNAEDSHLNV